MTALLYAQADGTLFVQSDHPDYQEARNTLILFAVLTQQLDPIHAYEIRPMSLWQAAALGVSVKEVLTFLRRSSTHPLPVSLQRLVRSEMEKWGRLSLQRGSRNRLVLRGEPDFLDKVASVAEIRSLAVDVRSDALVFPVNRRADLKRAIVRAGYPVIDQAGYQASRDVAFSVRSSTCLRPYQMEATRRFLGHPEGSGIVVLPCGAGKTLVGIAIAQALQTHTLILAPTDMAVAQWQTEFLRHTSLTEESVRRYEPDQSISPITVTTYQRLAARSRAGERRHLNALTAHPWGLVVYDEVHMLPAPLFRLAADLQSVRRLGLTATLVREDGLEADVFSLIGPKCYEVPWRQLEHHGYLASVRCVQVRVPFDMNEAVGEEPAHPHRLHRLASVNPNKLGVVTALVRAHGDAQILIIGHYLDFLMQTSAHLACPLVTGQTPKDERLEILEKFRNGLIRVMVLSRVANMAIDLPSASIAIQVSGLFGSRQEEAQRLGRLLRPHGREAVFYTLVSEGSVEERLAQHRQMFLVEQGYAYEIVDSTEIADERMTTGEFVRVPECR